MRLAALRVDDFRRHRTAPRTVVKPTDLRGILQYVPRFREKTFVLATDGGIVLHENFPNILLDIAVLRSLNIQVVLVHGASVLIRTLAEEQQITPSDLEGSGVTDAATLKLALTASNRLSHEVLEGLSASDIRGACCNAISARPAGIRGGIDHLCSGQVERVDVAFLETLLTQGIIPILPPLGIGNDSRTYRLNSDELAVAVAKELRATKLIFITTSDGLVRNGELIRQMSSADLKEALGGAAAELQSVSKARSAAAACEAGIPRVHIINGSVYEGLLAEVFSNEGIGTLIYANDYQQIRPARKKDIRPILNLIKASVASDELIRRTRTTLQKEIDHYYLLEIDSNLVGCVALHPHPDQQVGEVACLFVNSSHSAQGIGQRLVRFVEDKARTLGLRRIFALSTQAFLYFESQANYRQGTPEDLPPERRQRFERSRRRSKILVKEL